MQRSYLTIPIISQETFELDEAPVAVMMQRRVEQLALDLVHAQKKTWDEEQGRNAHGGIGGIQKGIAPITPHPQLLGNLPHPIHTPSTAARLRPPPTTPARPRTLPTSIPELQIFRWMP
jgi:hypothetical protein